MPFAYYRRLSAKQKRIYDRSDKVTSLELPHASRLRPCVEAIAQALARQKRVEVERAASTFANEMLRALRVSLVDVKVLARRPTNRWGELHGLYEPGDGRARPLLTVWMRTAQRKDVVAFRTFLRTLLHELGHHLDYALLGLEDSFHTQGFYRRESSLFHQLVPEASRGMAASGRMRPGARGRGRSAARGQKEHAAAAGKQKEPVQGSLFE